MQLSEALTSLGVTDQTLTQAEKNQLDRDGFLPLANILSAQQIAQITKRTDEMIAAEGQDAGKEVHQEAGATRLSDLVNKDLIFEPKNRIKDATEGKRFTPERVLEIDLELAKHSSELDELVKRISGLEQAIEELKDRKK